MPTLSPDVITAAQRGDPAAIVTLLTAAHPRIRRYARRSCSAGDIDDAVQDALCLLHRNVGSLRAVAAFWGWAFAIVRHQCLRLARRTLRGTETLESRTDSSTFATRPEHELRLDLAAAIEALPGHYREALLLRDMEELTIDEIATRCDTTREAIKARIRRARGLVREYLER
jgi:RNA polymerase sigma-70 factor (ECF subfamily)